MADQRRFSFSPARLNFLAMMIGRVFASRGRPTMRSTFALVIAICSLALAGCNSLRYASPADEVAAKRFAPVKGKAVVYLYRADDKNPDYVPLQFCRNCNLRSKQERLVEPAAWLFSN